MLHELGKDEESGLELVVKNGRYGPYVTDGKINATLPKGTAPEEITLERAVSMIKEKIARGPVKKRRFKRKS